MKYKKKPVEIYALQFFKDRWVESAPPEFFDAVKQAEVSEGAPDYHYIETLEGNMHVSEGDFVIRGVKGEFYPCKPDVFEMSYEAVSE